MCHPGFRCRPALRRHRAACAARWGCSRFAGAETCMADLLGSTEVIVGQVLPTVDRLLDTALDVVDRGVSQVLATPGRALDVVQTCEAGLRMCLAGAVSQLDITGCRTDLHVCLEEAEGAVEPILDILPDISPRTVIEDTAGCRTSTSECLTGAIGSADIASCGDIFTACIDAIDNTITRIGAGSNSPPPAQPGNNSCDGFLVQCLGSPLQIFRCTAEVRRCVLGG
jgi:hypothetical protein